MGKKVHLRGRIVEDDLLQFLRSIEDIMWMQRDKVG